VEEFELRVENDIHISDASGQATGATAITERWGRINGASGLPASVERHNGAVGDCRFADVDEWGGTEFLAISYLNAISPKPFPANHPHAISL